MKNRLTKGTKDILVNLLYHKKITIEVQLAINSEKSRFIEHSDKFNHFIYELERAEFGPVMELSKIWMVNDPRSEVYEEKINTLTKHE